MRPISRTRISAATSINTFAARNGYDAVNRVKVMKLLWDAIGSEFGSRHELTSAIMQAITRPSVPKYSQRRTLRASPNPIRRLADQCLAEYDLDGWTVPDLINSDDVNLIGKFN